MHCRTNVTFILKSKIKLRQVCGIAAIWFNIMQAGMEVEKDQMKWWDKEMGLMATSWKNNPKREETWGRKHGVWTLTWKWSVMAACATSKIGTYPHPQSVWQGPPSCLNPSLLEGSPNSMAPSWSACIALPHSASFWPEAFWGLWSLPVICSSSRALHDSHPRIGPRA